MTQDEIQAVALKPCPFCGCEVRLTSRQRRDPLTGMRTWYHIEGDHSGIGGTCPGEVRGRGSAETAIAAWNTRADTAPTPKADEVEAVARAIEDQLTTEDGWMVGTPALSSMCRDFAQAAIAALDAARGDSHNDVLSSCQPYLKQGETPAECIKRNRDDSIALMELLAAERIKVSNYEKTMAAIGEIENGEARRRRLETASEAQLIDYINELDGKLCAALDAARGDPVAQVVEWLRRENGLCDCHARCETECGCGAWDDWKTKPLLQIADAIERGQPFNG